MSFSFFKPSRPKTPQEVAKVIKDSLMALDTKTVVEVRALEKVSFVSSKFSVEDNLELHLGLRELSDGIHLFLNWRLFKCMNGPLLQAMEEVEKNFVTMRCMLTGDAEVEPNADQVLQLTQEICKECVIDLLIHKLPVLGWEVSYIIHF